MVGAVGESGKGVATALTVGTPTALVFLHKTTGRHLTDDKAVMYRTD